MSNGIKFVFLLSVILIVMFSMTFAQDTPFNAEVIVESARMRWGPGPAYAVQHYAGLGHILTVLQADAESDPPWTWYYARTPSGVQSWIRGDLVRRATGAAARVDIPTGTFPVVENNLCNTAIFRRCQDGTDHDLWTAGWWANDRYNHWETGGWNLDVVYHHNPCKSDRLCTTREQWDAGLIEAQGIAGSLTPEPTWTPVYIRVTSEVEIPTTWEILSSAAANQVLEGITYVGSAANNVYIPPAELRTSSDGSIFGEFRFSQESIVVTCQYWYLGSSGALIKSGVFRVDLNRLPETASEDGNDDDRSHVRCLKDGKNVMEDDVVARQWKFTLNRAYSGRGEIRGVSWRLTASYGIDEPTAAACNKADRCTESLEPGIRTYLVNFQDRERPKPEALPSQFTTSCEGRKTTDGEPPHEITRYEHTCARDFGTDDFKSELKFSFTHDETRGLLRPTNTPVTPTG